MNKQIAIFLGCVLALGLVATAVPGQMLWAQESGAQEETEGQGGETARTEDEEDNAQDQTEQSEDQNEDDESSARRNTFDGFIPSEEISDDLSVSFPVDI